MSHLGIVCIPDIQAWNLSTTYAPSLDLKRSELEVFYQILSGSRSDPSGCACIFFYLLLNSLLLLSACKNITSWVFQPFNPTYYPFFSSLLYDVMTLLLRYFHLFWIESFWSNSLVMFQPSFCWWNMTWTSTCLVQYLSKSGYLWNMEVLLIHHILESLPFYGGLGLPTIVGSNIMCIDYFRLLWN